MRADKLFWGLLLILIGSLFMLENLGYLEFSFSGIWRFWPVLLIYWGFSALLKSKDGGLNPFLVGIQVLLLALVLFFAIQPRGSKSNSRSWQWNKDSDSNNSSSSEVKTYDFSEAYDKSINKAAFELEFAAGTLKLASGNDELVNANANSNFGGYAFETEKKNGTVLVSMRYKNDRIKLNDSDDFDNTLDLQLHRSPVWDITMDMGATDATLDFTQHKIALLEIDCGAADIELWMGEPVAEKSVLKLNSGVANIDIKLPQDVACEIISNSALSSKNFEGFEEISAGVYRTPDFKSAKTTWLISLETGLSSVRISR
jgi:hypothetical protein